MVSFDPARVRRFTPENFREGAFVVERRGVHVFMWSEDDTPARTTAWPTPPAPPRGDGVRRESTLERPVFAADGSIEEVVPTPRSIGPVVSPG